MCVCLCVSVCVSVLECVCVCMWRGGMYMPNLHVEVREQLEESHFPSSTVRCQDRQLASL